MKFHVFGQLKSGEDVIYTLKKMFEAIMAFPEGWGTQKYPCMEGVWIFLGTTQCHKNQLDNLVSLVTMDPGIAMLRSWLTGLITVSCKSQFQFSMD